MLSINLNKHFPHFHTLDLAPAPLDRAPGFADPDIRLQFATVFKFLGRTESRTGNCRRVRAAAGKRCCLFGIVFFLFLLPPGNEIQLLTHVCSFTATPSMLWFSVIVLFCFLFWLWTAIRASTLLLPIWRCNIYGNCLW